MLFRNEVPPVSLSAQRLRSRANEFASLAARIFVETISVIGGGATSHTKKTSSLVPLKPSPDEIESCLNHCRTVGMKIGLVLKSEQISRELRRIQKQSGE